MPITTLTVAVGSTNPAKIRSVQQALEQLLLVVSAGNDNTNAVTLELKVQGFSVASGVPDQPMQDEDTKRGAKNRAKAAFAAFCATAPHDGAVEPHLAIGLEGGLEDQDGDLACMAWMAVYGKRSDDVLAWTSSKVVPTNSSNNNGDDDDDSSIINYTIKDEYSWGLAKTASFVLPPKVTKLIQEDGMELGDADDVVFSRIKSKHGSGTVGILTNGLIDRSKYYEHALLLAMVPWIRPDVYPTGHR